MSKKINRGYFKLPLFFRLISVRAIVRGGLTATSALTGHRSHSLFSVSHMEPRETLDTDDIDAFELHVYVC